MAWIDQGEKRGFGARHRGSNYPTKLIETLIDATGETPAVNQIEWNPFGNSDDMLMFCQQHKIIVQAYSPLTRTKRLGDESLRAIAARYDRTPAQIMLRWNLQRGTVPLPKANQREHLNENIRLFDFKISAQDMASINGLNERYSSLGSLPYESGLQVF